ncbi:MAG: FAD-dependent oxidoreductase, partial [Candidatus Sifarchaeia archaeon]
MERKLRTILVIGGGVAGIQASLDLAEKGLKVYLLEKTPSIGGRMAQLDKTFPTMDCSICILAPKMIEVSRNSNVEILTNSEIQEVSGQVGEFTVKILRKARSVDENKCVGCGICATKCPVKCPDEFNMGLNNRRAIYLPFPQAVPRIYAIDRDHCLYLSKGICRICEKFCEAKAVDFDQQDEIVEISVESIIVATGFDLFDPSVIKEYGYRRYKNVLTALEFERMISSTGPTNGRIVKMSDGKPPNTVTFIQCVGSRSLSKGYPYCSSVCCMYATKEAMLVKEHEPETDVYIFYTDLMVFGKGFQDFVNRATNTWAIN